jgi:gluconolactonase
MLLAVGHVSAGEPTKVETVATGLQFPEGTVFVGNTLYFVDYGSSDVLRLVDGAVQKVWHRDGCGANGLAQAGSSLLVACYDSGTIAEIAPDGRLIDTIRSDDRGLPFLYPNDLAADQKGGVYFTASGSETALGKVYYRGADRRVREVASNIHYANGLVVSLDGKRLYLAESAASRLLSYAIAPDAGLSDGKEFVKLDDVLASAGPQAFTPDGVRMDRYGNVFVALYRGGGFAVFSSDGKLIRTVKLPASHHSNLAISPDGKFVFVTAVYDTPGGRSRGEILKVPNSCVLTIVTAGSAPLKTMSSQEFERTWTRRSSPNYSRRIRLYDLRRTAHHFRTVDG